MAENGKKKSVFAGFVKGFKDGFKPTVSRAGGKELSESEKIKRRLGFVGSKR